uniref:Uncharacterized protein n=1 Tax=Arundo donax TaxID=35708 RepID=A0A0A9F122_ARUDO
MRKLSPTRRPRRCRGGRTSRRRGTTRKKRSRRCCRTGVSPRPATALTSRSTSGCGPTPWPLLSSDALHQEEPSIRFFHFLIHKHH